MKQILVIEDDSNIRYTVAEVIQLNGYIVLTAENGKVGLELIENLEYPPDMIICDLTMPVMDGYQVLSWIRKDKKNSHIPFIFLTAKVERENFRQAMQSGADDYLTKPFTPEELIEAIKARFIRQDLLILNNEVKEQQYNTVNLSQNINIIESLEKALHNQEFYLVYQPQINLNTCKIIGAEVLIRWQNNKLGMISPDKFIPIAEVSGLIKPIGKWVFFSACQQLKKWQYELQNNFKISVNVSVVQFSDYDFINQVKSIIKEIDIDPQNIEIEITESVIINNLELFNNFLTVLREDGLTIAIDDFGTGYSSLNHLSEIYFDTIKIDKAFISKINQDEKNAKITKSIINMSQDLKLNIIAEGVETQEQLHWLREKKCDVAQGYFFSRPLVNDQFLSFYSQF